MTGWLHFFFLARICHPPAIIRCLPCLVHESSLGFSSSWAPPPTEPTVSPPLVTHFLATPWLKGGKEIRTQWAKERSKAHPGCHVSKSTCSSYPHVLTFKSGLWSSAAAAAKSLQSCPTLCDPMDLQPTRLLCPWDFPGKSTGVGVPSPSLLWSWVQKWTSPSVTIISFFLFSSLPFFPSLPSLSLKPARF